MSEERGRVGSYPQNPEKKQTGVSGVVIRKAGAQKPNSWIQKVLQQIVRSPGMCVSPSEVVPVTVLAVQRYLLEYDRRDTRPKPPVYCYDVTISDGVYQEKCCLDTSLNCLVRQNILKVGIKMSISRVSCLYNEEHLGQGILCIDGVHCGEALDDISLEEIPFRNSEHQKKPERPLRGEHSHYLALWNNEDPYGDIWLTNKQPEDYNFKHLKLISLSHLEMTWSTRKYFPALLVRILYKSKLRYYGKPHKKVTEPYQSFLEIADCSGTVTAIMWNDLCPQWYKSLRTGLVLLLQAYSVKKSYPFRMQPSPVNPNIKIISSMEINLNIRDPPTNIIIIPEYQVKPEWGLPKLNHRFITRKELEDKPRNYICDVIGILSFVGRVQRSKKREKHEDFWSYRWIHIADGTSEQPFIVELFSTSQPEIFENIYPMAYFMCTQLRVVRNNNVVPRLLYLTTTNESRVFLTGQRGQPYAYEAKVKNFIQWVKTKTDSEKLKNAVIGGYYPYPPVPSTFSKYSCSSKVDSLLTAISEVKKVIEDLQYREQKRIAIQGIITAIKYIPHSYANKSTSALVTPLKISQPSPSQAAPEQSHNEEVRGKQHGRGRLARSQNFQTTSTSLSPSKKKRILQAPCGKLIAVPQREASSQTNGNKLGTSGMVQCPRSANTDTTGNIRFIKDRWESQLLKEKRPSLKEHLKYSCVYPESIPRKFILEHKKFLTQQYNSQPSKYIPPEGKPPKLQEFKSARSLGHFEVTILGLNHEIAIDVAFLPMFCPEDVQTSQVDTLLTCMNYSCVYPVATPVNEQTPSPRALAGDIIKAAAELDRVHIIGILDICNLGNNKVEVCLQKIYSPKNMP
ncbi:RPA-related protein RADX [Dipodomys merriami]|uniref:RPA-related protein RADX n=1 Tax=Dipodomys merriami TaxID=94247 RepID=UPI003855ED0B